MRCTFDVVVAGCKYHMRLGIGASLSRWPLAGCRDSGAGIPARTFWRQQGRPRSFRRAPPWSSLG